MMEQSVWISSDDALLENTSIQSTTFAPKREAVGEVIEDNFSMIPSQHFPLPSGSSLHKRPSPFNVGRPTKLSRSDKKVSRTVVCIPYNSSVVTGFNNKMMIKIPRGYRRTHFSKLGLIKKIDIGVSWSEAQLRLEISNCLKHCFVDCDYLTFSFLTTMPEFKALEIPNVHPEYQWDGATVSSLSKDFFYILANPCHTLKEEVPDDPPEPEIESADVEPTSPVNEIIITVSSTTKGQVTSTSNLTNTPVSSTSLYNNYLKLLSGDDPTKQTSQDRLLASRNELGRLQDGVEALELSLHDLRTKIDDTKINYLCINRQTLFLDAIQIIKRKVFVENGRIFVKFSDDLASNPDKIHTDGLNRELFRLLIANLNNSIIFAGEDHAKYLTKSDTANSEDYYFLFGRLIALSVIHGGPGPRCFSRFLYDQILKKPRTYLLSLITASPVHELIAKISSAATPREFSNAMKKARLFLELAGINQDDINCKNKVVTNCLKFYLEERVHEELERFMCGLNTMGLLDEVRKHPKGFEAVFLPNEEDSLTATKLMDEVFIVQYSEGRDAKKENKVIEMWQSYLYDIEDGKAQCRLEDILSFCTGADRIPPAGFNPKATITFSKTSKFPESKTCANVLSLPLGNGKVSYESFRDTMDFGILNSQGFG